MRIQNSIYFNDELEIIECSTFTSYLDISFELDADGKSTTQLNDKRDYCSYSIVNFPYVCGSIPSPLAYDVYILQMIWYARACLTYRYLIRGSLLTSKRDVTGVSTILFTGIVPQILR
jgi:hypothetical protein